MKQTFASFLVASAVAVTAAGLGAVGLDQGGQAQQSQSSSQASQNQSSQPGAQGRDEAAARQELVQAKQALMDLTKLPEAQQLQGEARNGVIQIINSFNSLVTAEANWYDRYQEVQQQLSRLLGDSPASGTATSGAETGSVGTSGSSNADMPAAIRSKLVEFRQHLEAFGKASGAPANAAAAGSASTAGSASAASAQSSTSGTGSQSTTASTAQEPASVTSAAGETFQQHFDAIADLVQQALGSAPAPGASTTGTTGSSTTGSQTATAGAASPAGTVTVDRAALEQIQSHLQRLRQLARQRGIQ